MSDIDFGNLATTAAAIASKEWDYDFWWCAFCRGDRLTHSIDGYNPLVHEKGCEWVDLRIALGMPKRFTEEEYNKQKAEDENPSNS